MSFFSQLYHNIGNITNRVFSSPGLDPGKEQDVGFASLGFEESPVEAIYPQWFFSAPLGQPRSINVTNIRQFARSPWVQMVLGTMKREIPSIPYDIVPSDPDDTTDYTEKIKEAKKFLLRINPNDQSIKDLFSESITDIGEIDAGIWNFVYSADSYDTGPIPILDAYSRVVGMEEGNILKPLGERTLVRVKSVDGGTLLKQVDIHKNLQKYYQYSFKHPRQNPTPFNKEEIVYMLMNQKSYDVYGFSPVQTVQQVLEVLIQGTRYNKDLFYNNAVPDILATLPKLPEEHLKKLKRIWNDRYQGKPHQIGFINWPIENFHKLADSNRDLEWLNGQKWYFRIVFAAFGVSPTEAGFFENANNSNDEGQYRVTVRNAMRPYLDLFERMVTTRLLTEIFQDEDHGLQFKFFPKDSEEEKIAFEQSMKEIEVGSLTINEYRKTLGRDDVEWGDEPPQKANPFGAQDPFGNQQPPDQLKESYQKAFAGFMYGRNTNHRSTGR